MVIGRGHRDIVQLQDMLGIGGEGRMNLPASGAGNLQWRFEDGDITDEIESRLKELNEIYARSL